MALQVYLRLQAKTLSQKSIISAATSFEYLGFDADWNGNSALLSIITVNSTFYRTFRSSYAKNRLNSLCLFPELVITTCIIKTKAREHKQFAWISKATVDFHYFLIMGAFLWNFIRCCSFCSLFTIWIQILFQNYFFTRLCQSFANFFYFTLQPSWIYLQYFYLVFFKSPY